ncbi:MAG: NAD(P)-dependent oxidoreductase [Spirochaetia bacterium]|nr:NAD(P)-dependent oxidoreductase [Spirochaetia bacterium]
MNIVVFGGAGFLGSHVCDKLSEVGHSVTIFDIRESPYKRDNQEMIVGDILDAESIRLAIKGKDIVFNFAGIADIEEAKTKPLDTVRYNVLANVMILDECRLANVSRFVYASTVYVYSKVGGFYRASKQASELYIENYLEQYNLDYTILRYGSLYGPRSDEKNGIYRFIKQALTEGEIHYYGTENALREYIHVEDAARLSVEILKPKYKNQHIVITGTEMLKVSQLFQMLREITNKDFNIFYETSNDHPHYEMVPYSYMPKVGMKLVNPYHVDLGQGLIQVVETVDHEHSNK